jgi:hypothetical protein
VEYVTIRPSRELLKECVLAHIGVCQRYGPTCFVKKEKLNLGFVSFFLVWISITDGYLHVVYFITFFLL